MRFVSNSVKDACSACLVLLLAEAEVTLRLTVSQSVRLGVEPTVGSCDQIIILSETCCLVSVGRPL
jgi:hypothetical protein